MLLLLHKTLKGSRNIQGFALIRAVLFLLFHNMAQEKQSESNITQFIASALGSITVLLVSGFF